jgi:endonuclease/exonuclease/phosphatase (EEP) superfamily protein YafD
LKIFRAFVYLGSLLTLAALAAGYFGALHPALDSFSHFRLHLAVMTALLGLLVAALRRYWSGMALVAPGLLVLVTTLGGSGFSPAMALPDKAEMPIYRLMQTNLRFDNETPNEVIRLIGEFKPDVIAAEEISQMWKLKLATLKHMYPHQVFCVDHNGLGDVAVLSRRPFVENAANFCAGGGGFVIQAVDFGGRDVLVGAMHLHWPWPFHQAREISELSPALKSMALSGLPMLMAGDTNSVPWSYSVERIAALSESAHLPFKGASWLDFALPSSWTGWLGLPIDNVFARDVATRSIETGRHVGSDHLPVLVEFTIQDAPEKPVETVFAN